METKTVTDLMRFDADAPTRHPLLQSRRLWSEIICLERGQSLGPFGDSKADGFFLVLAGSAVLFAGKRRTRLRQWESSLVPAATEITLRNAGEDPVVVLAVTAPPPATRGD